MDVDVCILGAGAAGLFCGIEAARRGRRVVVIDHAARAGEKIRISGGGRCNFTNLNIAPETITGRFLSQNPRFALSALRRFTARDFVARMDDWGIAWHERALGQLFCEGPATQVVAALTGDLSRAGGMLWTGCAVGEVTREGAGFTVGTARGPVRCAKLVVATGGKSIPKMGATGFGLKLAAQFGLPLVETRPALVPLTLAAQELARWTPLAGLSLAATARNTRAAFAEGMLFTHRGLSGPAILQLSSYWREGEAIALDLSPGVPAEAALRAARGAMPKAQVATALARLMPERLAGVVAGLSGLAGPVGAQGNAALAALARLVHALPLTPVGSEGYRTAEVMLGGVDTAVLDARTLEAKAVPGLHVIGEVVDVTGWLGGYNFQWAWSSGWAAGQAV